MERRSSAITKGCLGTIGAVILFGIVFNILSRQTNSIILMDYNYNKETNTHQKNLGILFGNTAQISHDITLINLSDKPIELLEARPLQPCCSSIGPLSNQVLARQSIIVPIKNQS